MVNRRDLANRVIRLLKLDITTFLTSLSPILSLYILGGFIDKEILGVFGFTYAFQFLWSMFSRGFNHPIFLYAFKDVKNDKNKTMSIVFSGCSVFLLLEVIAYLLFILYAKQYLILLKVPNELIDICYIYTIYAIAAIGLQVIDFMVFSFYEYTGRLEQNNKLGFLYALIRVGGALLYVFLNKSMTLNFPLYPNSTACKFHSNNTSKSSLWIKTISNPLHLGIFKSIQIWYSRYPKGNFKFHWKFYRNKKYQFSRHSYYYFQF